MKSVRSPDGEVGGSTVYVGTARQRRHPAFALVDELYDDCRRSPSDINEHLSTLRRYAERCDTITEMGVRRGVSTTAFLVARPTTVLSYDLDGRFFRKHREALYRRAAAEVGVDFRYIEGDVLGLHIAPTDLLFIDTWHVYEQLMKELEAHAPQTRRFILLHDTETFGAHGEDQKAVRIAWRLNEWMARRVGARPLGTVRRRPGLKRAVEEYLREHHEWRIVEHFTHNNGLTVLARTP